METANKIMDEHGHALMRDFGAFYPTGHLVVAFQQKSDADQVLRELQSQGAEFAEGIYYAPEQMAAFAQKNLAEAGIIASLGTSLTTVQSFLDAAREGASFLILPTPDDLTAQRAMEAVRRVPFVLAQRYHKLAIEDMK
jgi:2-keto-3-deoxy-6-phosphogluconate aldolase